MPGAQEIEIEIKEIAFLGAPALNECRGAFFFDAPQYQRIYYRHTRFKILTIIDISRSP
jgi:hypothetical protein